ncbi:DUF523 domain-containing protein [Thermodesulfatator atlanticus]|uniref:DUF523 domain-containing protein n=1 Tax=Thermodesulfatator atlanticus TaxID=501497 RepID=UPI0003B6DC15|nr:DUF523 domain-containing protein [Thermodesulfatator atlanticus]
MPTILVSACLIGLCTRYDGTSKPSPFIQGLLKNHILIPFCPEQLGGLKTPRPPAELSGGDGFAVLGKKAKVITCHGEDVTQAFIKGAEEAAKLAKLYHAEKALVKARSPSCGLTPVVGVAAARLILEGLSLEEID